MKHLTLISLCAITLLLSCKKDKDNYQIIFPGPYFPVYPNSWWKYIDQDSVITIHSVDPAYKLHKYVKDVVNFDQEVYSDPCYVPFYDGIPVYYYDRISFGAAYPFLKYYEKWPILNEQTGFSFQRTWVDPRSGNPSEIVVVKGKYFNGKDSILVQEGYWTQYLTERVTTQEWAKNIGLIRQFCRDTLTGDTISKTWLIDYYISFDSTSVDY